MHKVESYRYSTRLPTIGLTSTVAAIHVTHFSDVLCVWAYVSQVRMDELTSEFPEQVEIECRLFPVFGNARQKLETQWADKGGMPAYARHVIEVVAQFDHVKVHPDIWIKVAPPSSLPSHLYLCAVRAAESAGLLPEGARAKLAWDIRKAFFADLQNISDTSVLRGLVEKAGFSVSAIESRISSGEAHAALSEDMEQANKLSVRSSPTLIFNEDRQRLTGNVGYRIIEANIRELLEAPTGQQSWC